MLEVGDANQNQPFPVPNYVGLAIDETKIAAKDQNLEMIMIDEISNEPIGKVIKQRPESVSEKTISPGETITVWVSKEID